MKRILCLIIAAGFVFTLTAQQQFKVGVYDDKAPQFAQDEYSTRGQGEILPVSIPTPDHTAGTPARDVVVRDLGGSANAWGLSSGGRTYMWADNDLGSVVFIHRMESPPGSGYLAYDVSTDNGETWAVDQQVWDPAEYPLGAGSGNARYPQVAIYNPEGNTAPEDAVMTYFAPILDATNGDSWGGYGWGTNVLNAVNPTNPNMMGHPSPGGDILQSVPDAFHVTSEGLAFGYEPVLVDGLFAEYTGDLVLTSGYYDDGSGLFDYTQELMEFEIVDGASISNNKVAFGPDGQTGYLALLSNNGENTLAEGAYYPILFKTTNGGESWDGPYTVQLGGPDGLPAVLNYLSDELLEMLYEPPIPDRTELLFTTAFDMDVAVDAWGNPHLAFIVGLGSGDWSIYTSIEGLPGTGGMIAMIHATSYDENLEDWYADTLNTPYTFRGTFEGSTGSTLNEDTRPYISVTPDGTKMFFSWINTTIEETNIAPDIYCIGHNIADRTYSEVYNVTRFTSAMWQSWMGNASYYVFDYGGEYEIPFTYQVMNPQNNIDPVTFHYIDEFRLTDADLSVVVSDHEIEMPGITVNQNYPNPFREQTNVGIYLDEPANVRIDVTNLLGQTVRSQDYGYRNSGRHTLTLNAADLEAGVYLYTVRTNDKSATKQMIVE